MHAGTAVSTVVDTVAVTEQPFTKLVVVKQLYDNVPLDAAEQDTNMSVTILAVHDDVEDAEVAVDCCEPVFVGCVPVGFDSGSGVGILSFPMVIVGKFGKGGKGGGG